jgi:xylose isomerase
LRAARYSEKTAERAARYNKKRRNKEVTAMGEFFKNAGKIAFEGSGSDNPLSFKYYDADKVVAGKPMREHLKFAMSWWHTLCGDGTDMFGRGTADKSFGGKTPLQVYENKVYAGFELMQKLGIGYFCFHDRDIAPEADTLKATDANLDKIVPVIKGEMKRTGIKLLWGTANCFNHPRDMHGAGTSPYADVFAFAAAQIKKATEITVELGGGGYVFWGGREGYETLLNTDMGFELDNLARLLRLASDYARKIGFKGDFFIEPKPKEPTKHQYDFDAATALGFLRKYDLKGFKLNIEANHATLAGHTFQHELRVARENGAFGSIDANQGDMLLGWDTDQFPTDLYAAALGMYEVIKAGGFTNGGLNFDAKARRGSFAPEDLFYGHIAGMDTFAKGLLIAEKLIADKRIERFVAERYSSYKDGIGAEIAAGRATLETLEEYALSLGEVKTVGSGRQELLESILNSIILRG